MARGIVKSLAVGWALALLVLVSLGVLRHLADNSAGKDINRRIWFLKYAGPALVEHVSDDNVAPIFYDPSSFDAWCRANVSPLFHDLCGRAIPVVLHPHPESVGCVRDASGGIRHSSYAVIFMPEERSGLMTYARGYLLTPVFYAMGPYAEWPTGSQKDRSRLGRGISQWEVVYDDANTLGHGERGAKEFFMIANSLWQAAKHRDKPAFDSARHSFKPSDRFLGRSDLSMDKYTTRYTLSGEQLDAMAQLLDEKVFRSTRSAAQ
jgi:hypothetical protein